MKKRNVLAGAAVGILAVGIWLGSFWKGPGLGGLGTRFGTGPENGTSAESTSTTNVLSPEAREKQQTVSTDPLDEGPTDMLTVVIYGNEYRQLFGEHPQAGKLLTLDQIAARSKKMTGTPEGIRVRILKGKSAQEGARADLLKSLEESGVKREEIQERADFVE